MSEPARTKEENSQEFITVRIPADLAQFVNDQAAAMCNTKAGVIRYALSQFRQALESSEAPSLPSPTPKPAEVAA